MRDEPVRSKPKDGKFRCSKCSRVLEGDNYTVVTKADGLCGKCYVRKKLRPF